MSIPVPTLRNLVSISRSCVTISVIVDSAARMCYHTGSGNGFSPTAMRAYSGKADGCSHQHRLFGRVTGLVPRTTAVAGVGVVFLEIAPALKRLAAVSMIEKPDVPCACGLCPLTLAEASGSFYAHEKAGRAYAPSRCLSVFVCSSCRRRSSSLSICSKVMSLSSAMTLRSSSSLFVMRSPSPAASPGCMPRRRLRIYRHTAGCCGCAG